MPVKLTRPPDWRDLIELAALAIGLLGGLALGVKTAERMITIAPLVHAWARVLSQVIGGLLGAVVGVIIVAILLDVINPTPN